jgi:hypothetical protein
MRHLMAELGAISRAAACLVLAACAGLLASLSAAYGDPARAYLGMSEAEIVACAGEPYARYDSGPGSETLTYRYSGAGPVPKPPSKSEDKKAKKASPFGIKKKKDSSWTCSASLVFENGRLARVSFAPKDVRGPYDWQREKNPKKQEAARRAGIPTCSFSLPNCHR